MEGKVKILIVDDHTIVRQGLRALLETQNGFVVVGEAENGREAVKKAQELSPDVVIMDIAMPEAFFSAAAWSSRKRSKFSRTQFSHSSGLGNRKVSMFFCGFVLGINKRVRASVFKNGVQNGEKLPGSHK